MRQVERAMRAETRRVLRIDHTFRITLSRVKFRVAERCGEQILPDNFAGPMPRSAATFGNYPARSREISAMFPR